MAGSSAPQALGLSAAIDRSEPVPPTAEICTEESEMTAPVTHHSSAMQSTVIEPKNSETL
jgi:hypothetical protein